jgi:DNA-binding NarL/FixJ family response regulator
MPVRIIIADDHRIVREGLRHLLEKRTDFKVVAEAPDGESAVRLAKELSPDVVILDISMPGLNGIEATRRILAERPGVKVLALSMHSDRRFVIETLKAGASGYVLKDSAFDELARAIEVVMARGAFLSPAITEMVVRDYVTQAGVDDAAAFSVLTPREREVLQLMAEGESTKAIAGRLAVSVKTVETYRQQIMEKLDLHSVAELTKYAIREGLTEL